MRLEQPITIFMGIICNILLAFVMFSVQEVPYWAKYILIAGFNICVGMVIIAQLMIGENKLNKKRNNWKPDRRIYSNLNWG
jgi:hypothetical protein